MFSSKNQIECLNCNETFELNKKGKKAIFCPYCGTQIVINTSYERKDVNINKNIHIQDDAKVLRELSRDKEIELEKERLYFQYKKVEAEEKSQRFSVLICFIIIVICFGILFLLK